MEQGPAWTTTRERPMVITNEGKTFRAWASSGGVSAAGPAIPSNAHWHVAFDDGRTFGGPEAHPDDTEEDVYRIVAEIWREHRPEPRSPAG